MPNERPNQTIEKATINAVGETVRNSPEIKDRPFAERMESINDAVGQRQEFADAMRASNPELSEEQLNSALEASRGQLEAGKNIAEELGEGENVQALEQVKTSSEKGVLNHLWKYKWRYVIGAAALAAMIYGGYYAWNYIPGVHEGLSHAWEFLGTQADKLRQGIEAFATGQGGTPLAEGLTGSQTGGGGVVAGAGDIPSLVPTDSVGVTMDIPSTLPPPID